jgi:hypothetical protein
MDDLKVAPQYSVMALFFAIFIIGLALVAYMLKLAQRSEERSLNS